MTQGNDPFVSPFVSEADVELSPELVKFGTVQAIIYVVVLQLQHQVLVNLEVGSNAIHSLHGFLVGIFAIHIILGVNLEPVVYRNA